MDNTLVSKYLYQCKCNYFNGVRPLSKNRYSEEGYIVLVDIAKTFISNGKENEFLNFLQEYQYNINLWTAHLILEYGNQDNEINRKALEVIKRYSKTPIDEILAKEEKDWIIKYYPEYNN